MINKILVPTDGSECAYKALEWAVDLAEKYSAEVELLTVIPSTALTIVGPSELELQERGEKILKEAIKKTKKINPDLKISTRILTGRPAEKIVETAKEDCFDIIVMGARGLSRVRKLVLGNVSDVVVEDATCPVVIIK